MSTDQPPPPPSDQFQSQPQAPGWEQPPEKKGMGTGCKVFLILGIIFLVLILLCCGGLMWFGSRVAKGFSDDPEVVRSVTDEMLGIDIPDGLTPGGSMEMDVPFVGNMMTFVIWNDTASQSMLVLAQMGPMFAEQQNQQQMQQQLEQSLSQQGQGAEFNVENYQASQREVQIRGEPVTFTIATGDDRDTGAPRIQVTGMIPDDDGPIMVMFTGDADVYPEDAIVEMLESIE